MTVADLPRLTARQRSVAALLLDGKTHAEVATLLGWSRNAVAVEMYHARKRLAGGVMPTRGEKNSGVCYRGHPRQKGKHCNACVRELRKAKRNEVPVTETRAAADARIKREIAAGLRCSKCWLLRPCDHE